MLSRLQWDLGEWFWRDSFAAPDSFGIPFFQYIAQHGRHIQLVRIGGTPAVAEHWRRQGISREFLSKSRLRSYQRRTHITSLLWLLTHRGMTVGVWPAYSGLPLPALVVVMIERHDDIVFGPAAHQVWGWILRFMTIGMEQQTFTWGSMAWCRETRPAMRYKTCLQHGDQIPGEHDFTDPDSRFQQPAMEYGRATEVGIDQEFRGLVHLVIRLHLCLRG